MPAAAAFRKDASPSGNRQTGRRRRASAGPSTTALAAATSRPRRRKAQLASSVRLDGVMPPPAPVKMSHLLLEILAKTRGAKTISLEQIFAAIGETHAGPSLMLMSLPAILPVSGTSDFVGLPGAAVAGHMMMGQSEIKLSAFLLERSVSRKSLSVIIHAILPALQMLEKVTKPRWRWINNFAVQRLLGIFVFILALALAFPILGFTVPHAAALFMISLGMVEQDGLAVLIGVVVGVASLILMTGLGLSAEMIRSRAGGWVKRNLTFLARTWAAKFLEKRSLRRANLLTARWADLLLLWQPEAVPAKISATPARRCPKPRKKTARAV